VSWAPVRSTVGVASLVRFGGQVAPVPEALVETLRTSAVEPQHHRPIYQQGQKVRIVAGPFATLEGVFDMAEGESRAAVLLDLLGRQSRVRVEVGEIGHADWHLRAEDDESHANANVYHYPCSRLNMLSSASA
jgi:transcriptional antiterminator RfaH